MQSHVYTLHTHQPWTTLRVFVFDTADSEGLAAAPLGPHGDGSRDVSRVEFELDCDPNTQSND